jgi:4-hydroxy-tetrahydrodipicolinate reductase
MSGPLAVAVAGASGQMGAALIRLIAEGGPATGLVLRGAWDRPDSPLIGAEVAPGVRAVADAAAALNGADVYIDFTRPEASLEHARLADSLGIAGVVGTTGFDGDPAALLAAAAPRTPLVWAANFSVGVNLLLRLVEDAAAALSAADADAEIVELHHRRKVDAPSGTAVALLQAVQRGRGEAGDVRHGRQGIVGARPTGEIAVHAVRGGDIVGDHTVYFIGGGERLELTHRAHTRDVFAHGALRAARWIVGRAAGVHGMRDVLASSAG